jgi:hypothetical protein
VADSTRTPLTTRRLPQRLTALVVALAIVPLAALALAGQARADGDPASDVLVAQRLFLPQDAGLQTRQQAQLGALLSAAQRSGYPLRVAVIASPADLGSITELWRRPQSYARFLGQELSLNFHGTLLVVMPNGFGLYGPGAHSAAQRAALAQAESRRTKAALGATAIAAVGQLATAAGHPLTVGAISTGATPAKNDSLAWLALLIGALLIVVAWIASLRARPLRSGPESVA